MALMVFKVTFYVRTQKGSSGTIVVKTITHNTDSYSSMDFDLQRCIDNLSAQLKKEGWVEVEVTDVVNISTPIVRRKY